MNIILDTCILHKVFGNDPDFQPIYDRLVDVNNPVKMAYGGTKYNSELSKQTKYLKFIRLLSTVRQVEILETDTVDTEQSRCENLESSADFDDPHIIAIMIVGKCKVVCTDDTRSDKYIKDKKFYPKRFPRPKIYRYKAQEYDIFIKAGV